MLCVAQISIIIYFIVSSNVGLPVLTGNEVVDTSKSHILDP